MKRVESILRNDRSARGLSAAETRAKEIAKARGERLLSGGEAEREDEEKGRFHVRANDDDSGRGEAATRLPSSTEKLNWNRSEPDWRLTEQMRFTQQNSR